MVRTRELQISKIRVSLLYLHVVNYKIICLHKDKKYIKVHNTLNSSLLFNYVMLPLFNKKNINITYNSNCILYKF